MKKWLPFLLSAALLTSSMTACVIKDTANPGQNSASGTESDANTVKNCTNSEYPGTTWGTAFESYFSDTGWKYFSGTLEGPDENSDGKPDFTENNTDIVEFTGHCMYSGTDVLARVQFRINSDSTFEPVSLSFNGVPQSNVMLSALIEKAFENAPKIDPSSIDGLAPAPGKENTPESEPPAETAAASDAVTILLTQAPENKDPRIGTPFDRKVVVSDSSAGIYLRPEPDLDAEWLTLIPKNTIVTVYNCDAPGWFYTTYDGKSGYIYAEYTKDPNTNTSSSHTYIGEGRVDVSAASAGIYLRPYASLDAEWLTLIPKNEIIDLYSCDSSDWYYTYYDGKEGYVYADYISRNLCNFNYSQSSSGNYLGYGTVSVSAASAGIYLRPYCDLDAEWLLLIPKNTSIPLYSCGNNDWYYTTYDGQSGYVYADYVAR